MKMKIIILMVFSVTMAPLFLYAQIPSRVPKPPPIESLPGNKVINTVLLTVKAIWTVKGNYFSEKEYDADYKFIFRKQFDTEMNVIRTRGYDPSKGEFLGYFQTWSDEDYQYLESYGGQITVFRKKEPPLHYQINLVWTDRDRDPNPLEASGALGTGIYKKDSIFSIAAAFDPITGTNPGLWIYETTIGSAHSGFSEELNFHELVNKNYLVKEVIDEFSNSSGYHKDNGVIHVFLSPWCENSKFVPGKDFQYKNLSNDLGEVDADNGKISIDTSVKKLSKYERNVIIQHEMSHHQDYEAGWIHADKYLAEEEMRAFKREMNYYEKCKPKKGRPKMKTKAGNVRHVLFDNNGKERFREDIRMSLENNYGYAFDD